MRKPTLKEAIQNVRRAFPGSEIFVPGPHNLPDVAAQLKPARKSRRKKT